MSFHFRVVLAGLALIAGACVHPSARPTRIPIGSARELSQYTSAVYRDPAHWLCLPGRTGDACRGDLTATEIRADGTRLVVREAYTGQCTEGAGGFRYLAISPPDAPGDTRASLLGFNDTRFGFWMGLHVLDYQFPQGDLIEMVRRRSRGASPAAD